MSLDTRALLQGWSRKITGKEGDTEQLNLHYVRILICIAKRGQNPHISSFNLIRPTIKHQRWFPSIKGQAKGLV